MKKFFSLVLALVMALSLTTVAWGADVAEYNGTNYGTLQKAVDAAESAGGTITLLADVTEDVVVQQAANVAIVIDGTKSTTENYTISGTITVDGKSATIMTAGITIKNVNFDATSISKDACINLGNGTNATRYVCNLTVDNCTFTGNYPTTEKVAIKSYTGGDKNVTVTGCTATAMHSLVQLKNATGVTVSDCTVTAGKNGISLGASANVAVTECTMEELVGYGIRADANDVNAAPGTLSTTITDCDIDAGIPVVVRNATVDYTLTFAGTNTMTPDDNGIWCAVGTSEYEPNGTPPSAPTAVILVTVNDSSLDTTGVYGNTPAVAKVGTTEYVTLAEAVAAAAAGDIVKLLANNDEDVTVGKAIIISLNGYAFTGRVTANTGYQVIKNTAGDYVVLSATSNVFDVKDAKTMTAQGAMSLEMVPAKDAYVATATGNWVPGYVKHYVDEYGTTYVPCTADVEGALYLYYKGTKSVYDVVVAANPVYAATATEFTNFGTGCGQLDNRADTTVKYYTVVDGNGVKSLYQGTTATANQVMVNGKLVGVVPTDLINALNDHKWVVEKNAKNEITAAKCSLCGQAASWTLNKASIPTGAEFEPAPGGGYLYWSTAPVATEKPSTDKVTSAETFDAGIAMYVGMSVMAAAGSAVVLKKKD